MSPDLLLQLPLLFFSIIVHEYSHGFVAERFGDDTAREMGRLTFNPIAHVDLFGTIFLPLLCLLTNAPIFGWAKPVPVDAARMNDPKKDLLIVAAAGPLINFFLASLFAGALWLVTSTSLRSGFYPLLAQTLNFGVLMNLYLCVFNLLPIHPLDGSKVLSGLLPREAATQFDRLAPHGFIILILLMVTGIFGHVITPVVYWLYQILV